MLARRMVARSGARLVSASRFHARNVSVTVGWGSHSGTASFLADQLADELQGAGLPAKAVDQRQVTLDTISKVRPRARTRRSDGIAGRGRFRTAAVTCQSPPSQPSSPQAASDDVVVFMNACFGQGEPTANSKALYDSLLDEANEAAARAAVSGRRYAVFGLGASRTHCAHYQVIGRNIDNRLEELGGVRVLPMGEGDDSHDVEADFESWKDLLIDAIKAAPAPAVEAAADDAAGPAEPVASAAAPAAPAFSYDELAGSLEMPNRARVTEAQCVSAVLSPRAVYRVKLVSESGARLDYQPGDHISILPQPNRHAERLAASLGRAGDGALVADALGAEMTAATPPAVLRRLAALVEAGGGGPDFAARVGRRVAVLDAFDAAAEHTSRDGVVSAREAAELVAALPRVRPRMYSVASDPDDGDGTVAELLVRRVRRPSSLPEAQPATAAEDAARLESARGREAPAEEEGYAPTLGVCSTWLTGTQDGVSRGGPAAEHVAFLLRDAGFRLPEDPGAAVFMVAGGVGLAPFVGFWRRWQSQVRAGTALGRSTLVRCTATAADALLSDDIAQCLRDGSIAQVVDVVAEGAREPCSEGATLAASPLVGGALDEEPARSAMLEALGPDGTGHFYVCGGAGGFGAAVMDAVESVMGPSWGGGAVAGLLEQGRWHEDLAD